MTASERAEGQDEPSAPDELDVSDAVSGQDEAGAPVESDVCDEPDAQAEPDAAGEPDPSDEPDAQDLAVDAYWATARKRAGFTRLAGVMAEDPMGMVEPPAWSFGADPEQANELLSLVLAGTKTATASAAASYGSDGAPMPEVGDLSIILDGRGRPRALIATTDVQVCRFDEVDAEHAAAEGEGDRSLEDWREVHEVFLTEELARVGQQFDSGTAVVLERFQLLDP